MSLPLRSLRSVLSHAARNRASLAAPRRALSSRQLVLREHGDPAVAVSMETTELPPLKAGQVLVRMLAAPIHPADINTIQGTYAIRPALPCVLGNEGVGEVVQSRSDALPEGRWVAPSCNAFNTWQSHVVATPEEVVEVPSSLPLPLACTLTNNPGSAYRMLQDYARLAHGDTVIQNGANSAVGRAVIQLCRAWGFRSVNVIRDRPDVDALKQDLTSLGADVVLTEGELRAARGDLTLSAGVALNCVSGRSATELLRCLREGGVMVTYGGMARQPVTVPVGSFIFRDVRLVGHWQTRWTLDPANASARLDMMRHLARLALEGRLSAPPHVLVAFDEYRDALAKAMPADGRVGFKQILRFD